MSSDKYYDSYYDDLYRKKEEHQNRIGQRAKALSDQELGELILSLYDKILDHNIQFSDSIAYKELVDMAKKKIQPIIWDNI